MMGCAVLAPGFGGSASQPILVRIAKRLEAEGLATERVTFSTRGRPTREYLQELADLRAVRDALLLRHHGPVALIGRSFGGRMTAFLAEQEPPDALVILSHPIAPPGKPRPRDEAVLAALQCPTLIVQGERDELGPLADLERVAAHNPRIDIVRLAGVGHDLGGPNGSRVAEAIEHVVRWLSATLA